MWHDWVGKVNGKGRGRKARMTTKHTKHTKSEFSTNWVCAGIGWPSLEGTARSLPENEGIDEGMVCRVNGATVGTPGSLAQGSGDAGS